MKPKSRMIAAAICLSALSTSVLAGVEIKGFERPTTKRREAALSIAVDGALLRIDQRSVAEDVTILFNSRSRIMTLLDHRTKSFIELTARDVSALKIKKDISASQSAAAGLDAGAGDKPAVRVVSLYHQKRLGKWVANHYEAREGHARVGTFWIAPWSRLGIDRSELVAVGEMLEFTKNVRDLLPSGFDPIGGLAAFETGAGIPVKAVSYENRVRIISDTEFSDIEKKSIPAQRFTVPPDYVKKDVPKS